MHGSTLMVQPGHLGQKSKTAGGAVIWRCTDRPLLLLTRSLIPPSAASRPPILSACHHADSCPLSCRHEDLPGDWLDGRDVEKGMQTKRNMKEKMLRWKPGFAVVAHNRSNPFYPCFQSEPGAERQLSERPSFHSTMLQSQKAKETRGRDGVLPENTAGFDPSVTDGTRVRQQTGLPDCCFGSLRVWLQRPNNTPACTKYCRTEM